MKIMMTPWFISAVCLVYLIRDDNAFYAFIMSDFKKWVLRHFLGLWTFFWPVISLVLVNIKTISYLKSIFNHRANVICFWSPKGLIDQLLNNEPICYTIIFDHLKKLLRKSISSTDPSILTHLCLRFRTIQWSSSKLPYILWNYLECFINYVYCKW